VAWFAQALPYITVIVGAVTQVRAGQQERANSEMIAAQMDQRAKQTRALASRQIERLRRANQRVRARARSLLAASGFSVSDVGANEMDLDLIKEGSINELLAAAQGEDEARQEEMRARLTRAGGKQAQTASSFAAATTLVESYGSWRDRYGGGRAATRDTLAPPSSNWAREPDIDPYHRNP
jgi:hypothetical protein